MSVPTTTTSSSDVLRMKLHRPDEFRILAFGDSLTEGYTDFGTRFHPYGPALKARLNELLPDFKSITVDVKGQSGDRVLNSLCGRFETRLHAAIAHKKHGYDLTIILGGTNDLAFKAGRNLEGSTEIFEEGLKGLYEYVLGETEGSLLVMTVPERSIDTKDNAMGKRMRENREYLNSLISQWVQGQTERVYLMDLAAKAPFPPFANPSEDEREVPRETLWSADGLHMSAAGYDFVGRELADAIYSLLEQ